MEGLTKVAAHDAGNEWARLAILSGLGDSAWPYLQRLFQLSPAWRVDPKPDQEQILSRLGAVIGASGRKDDIRALVRSIAGAEGSIGAPWALMSGLVDGLARTGQSLSDQLRDKDADLENKKILPWMVDLATIVVYAKKTAFADDAPTARRVAAAERLCPAQRQSRSANAPGLLAA